MPVFVNGQEAFPCVSGLLHSGAALELTKTTISNLAGNEEKKDAASQTCLLANRVLSEGSEDTSSRLFNMKVTHTQRL